jgi:hypothetical protein
MLSRGKSDSSLFSIDLTAAANHLEGGHGATA